MARAEVGCSAPVNNVPPSSVLACASLLTQSVIDTLAGRFELVDEVYAASNPDPLKLLAFRGPADWPTGILARRRQRGIDQIGERSRRLLIRRSRVRIPEGPPPHFFIRAGPNSATFRAWSSGLQRFGSWFRLTSSPHQSVHGWATGGRRWSRNWCRTRTMAWAWMRRSPPILPPARSRGRAPARWTPTRSRGRLGPAPRPPDRDAARQLPGGGATHRLVHRVGVGEGVVDGVPIAELVGDVEVDGAAGGGVGDGGGELHEGAGVDLRKGRLSRGWGSGVDIAAFALDSVGRGRSR